MRILSKKIVKNKIKKIDLNHILINYKIRLFSLKFFGKILENFFAKKQYLDFFSIRQVSGRPPTAHQ